MKSRSTMKSRCPARTSTTRSGVASIAWYCRFHLMAPITGYVDSNDVICIAEAASRPGAMNSR